MGTSGLSPHGKIPLLQSPPARMLGRAGGGSSTVQSRGTCPLEPPVFTSRLCAETLAWLDGSAGRFGLTRTGRMPFAEGTAIRRSAGGGKPPQRRVQVAAGAVFPGRPRSSMWRAIFLIGLPGRAGRLYEQGCVHRRCRELGIPVPRSFGRGPDCLSRDLSSHTRGKNSGLKAQGRYPQANKPQIIDLPAAMFPVTIPSPIVQEEGGGGRARRASLLAVTGGAARFRHVLPRRIRAVPRLRALPLHLLRS